jgi:hypothetical protein
MRVAQYPEGAETFGQKGWRKMKEQPLVPLGVFPSFSPEQGLPC